MSYKENSVKVDGNQLRPKNVISHLGRLYVVVKAQHTQPGKGGAYMQVELKDLQNGSKLNERFRAAQSVERVHLEEKVYQFLYEDAGGYVLMDNKTYEQITVPKEAFVGDTAFLKEEMESVVYFDGDGTLLYAELPPQVVLEVVHADPVVKGQTATSSYKSAQLENGKTIMVPPHIESGTKVVVDTRDGSYVERYKG